MVARSPPDPGEALRGVIGAALLYGVIDRRCCERSHRLARINHCAFRADVNPATQAKRGVRNVKSLRSISLKL